jgi:aminotransferase EvaB
MKVWDYKLDLEKEKQEILSAIEEVLQSGQLILGEKVRSFESRYASYCRVAYGVGVDNGTNAVFLALKALDISAGDEVITVANTAVPTVSAIVSCGARPVFVDVEEQGYLMDVTKIEAAITPRTRCILPVHLFGQCADMDEVNRIAKKHGLFVLEDCAQCHGASYKGRNAGSMSDIAATSFYPTKILGTYGDAGMVLTQDEERYHRLLRLRTYGMDGSYYSVEHGYNCRLDEIHAAILLKKLDRIESYIDSRRNVAGRYREALAETSLILPKELDGNRHCYYLYVVRHPQREQILEALRKHDIFLNISYPWPIHRMEGYQWLGYHEGDLPVCEKLAGEIFSLPMYPSLPVKQQDAFIETLTHTLKEL